MQFGLLGSVVMIVDGRAHTVSGAQPRAVLAWLLLAQGHPVSVEMLVDVVWGTDNHDLPPRARNTVQQCVSKLRRMATDFGLTTITTHDSTYRLDIDPREIDLYEFRRYCRLAREAADPATSAAVFEQALALWRGEALLDVTAPGLASIKRQLTEEYQAALDDYVDARLVLGDHERLVAELVDRVVTHPLRERVHGQLMQALHGSGRTQEALDAYRACRDLLLEQTGAEPGTRLRHLHQQILADDPALPHTRPAGSHTPSTSDVRGTQPAPRQLPALPGGFAGRDDAMTALDTVLAQSREEPARNWATVAIIDGMAGVGKTALAVSWAHRAARHFPHGQLYVDLRGFDPVAQPLTPHDVIVGFLHGLGVPTAAIPSDERTAEALYRTLTADRDLLVVLDNAHDTHQVRPLLPTGPRCLTLITSRDALTGLVATHTARTVALHPLTPDEAGELMAVHLGPDRVRLDATLVSGLIDICGGLPLALRILAARATAGARVPLSRLLDELRDSAHPLRVLRAGDSATDITAVFSCSYTALTAPAAKLFRLLGLHPGPSMSYEAIASLAGTDGANVASALDELLAAHMTTEVAPNRYALHDLLREYALDLAESNTPTPTSTGDTAARKRLYDHYLHTAASSALILYPTRDPITLPPADPACAITPHVDEHAARDWFRTEHHVLMAIVRDAHRHDHDRHVWQLAWAMVDHLDRHGYWNDYFTTQTLALASVTRLGDLDGQARIHRGLGRVNLRLGHHDQAATHLTAALQLHQRTGDQRGQAHTRLNLAWLCETTDHLPDALAHAQAALVLLSDAGDSTGEANALNTVGWYLTLTGEHTDALHYCQRALALHRDLGDVQGEADTLDSLGEIHYNLDEPNKATRYYARALHRYRKVGNRYDEASTAIKFGDCLHKLGQRHIARTYWHTALRMLTELGHPDAEDARQRLDLDLQ